MKTAARVLQLGAPLRQGHMRYLRAQLSTFALPHRAANLQTVQADSLHLSAACSWLAAAQDSQKDGGISGRYRLASGWSSSYPETTGYLIPTLLQVADHLRDDTWLQRASRAVQFLLTTQLPDGSFPGGEIAQNRVKPSPFNTAQILHGLNAWYLHRGEPNVKEAARRAANWLCRVQDDDGAFRKFFYYDQPATYSAHLSCWLAEHGVLHGDRGPLSAAARHLSWVLGHQDKIYGWFDLCGFDAEQHHQREAYSHTIAYTVWGVLLSGILLQRPEAIDAAAFAAERVMRRLELSGYLPGVLRFDWKAVQQAQCLTGNAQMALVWLKLHQITRDSRYVNAALKAIDNTKRAQDLDNPNSGVRGGLAGSWPVWGNYISMALPNWAVKFFIDALLAKGRTLQRLSEHGS